MAPNFYWVRLFFVDGFFAYSWAFMLADDPFRFALRVDSARTAPTRLLSGSQPGLITAPGRCGPSPPARPPEHSRGVLVRCRGKGDASAMVVVTSRFSGRAFWVALGATSGRGRLDRRRRAGEAPKTVRVYPVVRTAKRRLWES